MTEVEKESGPVQGLKVSSPSPLLKRSRTGSPYQSPNMPHKRRKRTKQDFLNFCSFVLQYEAYKQDENNNKEKSYDNRESMSPESSSGSDVLGETNSILMDERIKSRLIGSQDEGCNSSTEEAQSGEEGADISCFCGKPFANRPMIECGSCEIWIHLSCAKIRKNHIPDVFICPKCRDISNTSRKSPRVRVQNKKFDTDL